jgi:hypothetical protein
VKRLDFQKAPKFCKSAKVFLPEFSDLPKLFLSLPHFQRKICKKSNAMSMQKTGAKAKITKQSKAKSPLCVLLKLSENCKKNVKS